MKTFLIALLLLFTTAAFSQSKKVALIIASLSTDDELNYATFIRPYVEEHLKQLPGIVLIPFDAQVSQPAKNKRKLVSGSFVDNDIAKIAAAKRIEKLVLVYYDGNIIEKKC